MPIRHSTQPTARDDEWLTLWDAASHVRVTFDRISRACIDGELPIALRDGRDRVHVADVDAWRDTYRTPADLSDQP